MSSPARHSIRRQLSVITIDQAVAGGSNVLIAVIAARLLSAASFGLFGIVFLLYIVVQGVSRALVNDPLLVHPEEGEERRDEVIGTSCMLGLALGVGVVLLGVAVTFVDASLGDAIVVLGVFLPLLAIEDLGRYLGFAIQRPASALVLDLVWLGLLCVAVVPLFVTGTHSLAWLTAAWAGSGAVAGLLVFWQHRSHRVRFGAAWLRYTWGFSWRYLISYVSTQSGALAASASVAAIAGAKALGGVQGALLLVRPFMTFQIAVIAASVGHVTRSLETAAVAIRSYIAKVSVLTTAAAAVNVVVMLVLPDGIGRAILGDSWHVAQPLLLATGVQVMFLAFMTGPRAGLLGMRAIRRVMMIDVVMTILIFTASVIGAEINGALGAVWAIDVVVGGVTAVMWATFLAHTARPEAEAPIAPEALPPEPAPTPPAI